jgi:putative NADPH-quinone reductase
MKISLILAHPDPGSFNHAMADAVGEVLKGNGHQIFYHDLYGERFDPVLKRREIGGPRGIAADLRRYCEEIRISDGIVIVHPNWWGQPPAILKGWVDRVLRQGVAYRFEEGDGGEGIPRGLLKARTALVFNTSNTPERREREVFGDPLEDLWGSCVLKFCGVRKFVRRMYGVIVTSTAARRLAWLAETRNLTAKFFPVDEPGVYNRRGPRKKLKKRRKLMS